MKNHLITSTILIALLVLLWAMATIEGVFIGVITGAVLTGMYISIYMAVIGNKGVNK
jgi:hypothetical protein